MVVWILNTDPVNICIWMTFMYVDYEMNYLTEMQTIELERQGSISAVQCAVYVFQRESWINTHLLIKLQPLCHW